MTPLPRGRAVIIGAGMAGLLAAHVLAQHMEEVLVLERDVLPHQPLPRDGVPQGRHAHVLLVRGYRILRRFFPSLDQDLAKAGAPTICWTQDVAALLAGGWMPRFPSDILGPSASREFLEWQVRQYVAAHPRVSLRGGHRVVDLHFLEKERVGGVVAVDKEGQEQIVPGDLVVDASGRSSRLPQWLEKQGYPAPAETRVNAKLGYSTRWYRIPPGWQADWKVVLLAARFPNIPRGAVILPVEGERWVVTLAGTGGDYPPTDPEGFLAFARSLAGPQVHQAIAGAEPLSPVYGYRRTENRWRHLERLPAWPRGLLALGDTVGAFNPVYGQGMTVAALAAEALDALLSQDVPDLERAFQKRLAAILKTPWTLATGEDLRWAGQLSQAPSLSERFLYWYLEQMGALLHKDRTVARTFLAVTHLLASPAAFFHPRILAKVAAHLLTSRGSTDSRLPTPTPSSESPDRRGSG